MLAAVVAVQAVLAALAAPLATHRAAMVEFREAPQVLMRLLLSTVLAAALLAQPHRAQVLMVSCS